MEKRGVLKNISYTMTSNLISILISVVVTFFVPKFLGVESYGYFQLFIFFSGYTGFLYFGWGDGLYLRYGGEYYDNLNKRKFSGQFWGIMMFAVLMAVLISLYDYMFVSIEEKRFIWICIGLYIILMWPKTILQFTLQCTNRIKEYSFTVIVERVTYLIIVILLLFGHLRSFKLIVVADLVGRFISLLLAMWFCRDIVKSRPEPVSGFISETKTNINIGIKLMLSNIAGMLVIGIVRYSIENQWDVAVFGKVSLSLSVSNMLMVFINAVALVMFPMLRRTNPDQYAKIYELIRNALMVLLLGMLILYYPVKLLLSIWLPQYRDSIVYMAVLFPICIFEGKNGLLITTYLKTLRKEKWLLLINVITMIVSLITTWITVYILHNLDLAVLSIVVMIGFRCVLSETLLSRMMNINVKKDIAIEIIVIATYIVSNWKVGGWLGMVLYCIMYLIYILFKWKNIKVVKKYILSH